MSVLTLPMRTTQREVWWGEGRINDVCSAGKGRMGADLLRAFTPVRTAPSRADEMLLWFPAFARFQLLLFLHSINHKKRCKRVPELQSMYMDWTQA